MFLGYQGRTVASVRRALERWRRSPGRSRRIPPALWQAAGEVAREHGVSRTARELGLDYYALARRAHSGGGPGESAAFVELAVPAGSRAPQCRLELSDGGGARLCIELNGAEQGEIEALARTLWSAVR